MAWEKNDPKKCQISIKSISVQYLINFQCRCSIPVAVHGYSKVASSSPRLAQAMPRLPMRPAGGHRADQIKRAMSLVVLLDDTKSCSSSSKCSTRDWTSLYFLQVEWWFTSGVIRLECRRPQWVWLEAFFSRFLQNLGCSVKSLMIRRRDY